MMNFARLRNGKTRVLLGLAAGAILLIITFVIHDTHTKLVSTRGQVQDCEHRQESLAAQLQVVHEHRTRLEKALQLEKLTHKQTKEKLESQFEELQEQTDKEKQELLSKYATLQQQYKALQSQQEDLHEEFSKLQQTNAELQEEKQNVVNKMTSQLDQLRIGKDEEISQLQISVGKLQQEKEDIAAKMDQTARIRQLEDEIDRCQKQLTVQFLTVQQAIHPSKLQPSPIVPKPNDFVKPSDTAAKGPPGAPLASTLVQTPEKAPKFVGLHDGQLPGEPNAAEAPNGVQTLTSNKQLVLPRAKPRDEVLNLPGVLPLPKIFPEKGPQSDGNVVQQDNNDGHQLANPHDADIRPNEEVQKQLEQPRKMDAKKQAMAESRVVRNRKESADVHHRGAVFGQEGEPEANGLEQQENGDQDLDDMENEILGEKRDNHQFEDADFDQEQDDNEGNRDNNHHPQQAKQESVIAAPH